MASSGDTMKAAMYRSRGAIELVDLPRPTADDGKAVVAVEYCGVCGTDLHMVLDGWGTPDSVFGHEWAGRIVEPGATGLEPGAFVVGLPSPVCGACTACRDGRPSLCRNRPEAGTGRELGAFAEFVGIGADRLIAVPDGVDPRFAAYTEPLAVALHAVHLSAITAGQTALVMGAGPIGAAILALLQTRGIETTATEPGPARAELAASLGARVRPVDDLTITAHPGDAPHDAVDVVFETSGVRSATETALTQLGPGGILVLVGTGLDAPKLNTNRVILNELRITGAFNYDAGGFESALDLIASGELPLDRLIAPGAVALTDLLPTMQRLRAGEIPGKVMIRP